MHETIRILGISGSPRQQGNTSILLDIALQGAAEAGAEIVRLDLNNLKHSPCQECGACDSTGECILHDDMDEVYEQVRAADGIIIASPIFFGTVSAQTKMMIDRFQCWWATKYLLQKETVKETPRFGIFICVGGMDTTKYCENAESVVKVWFLNIDVKHFRSLLFHGYDKAGDILKNAEAVEDSKKAGEALAIKIQEAIEGTLEDK